MGTWAFCPLLHVYTSLLWLCYSFAIRNKVAIGNRLLSAFYECLHKSAHMREGSRAPGLETADQTRLGATWDLWLASELKAACAYRLCRLTLIPESQYQNCLGLEDMQLVPRE